MAINKETSKSKVKKLNGLSAMHGKTPVLNVPTYLIGQIAKNDTALEFEGKKLIDSAVSIINNIHRDIGGRSILIECADNEKLISYYKAYGFEFLQKDENDELMQLISYL